MSKFFSLYTWKTSEKPVLEGAFRRMHIAIREGREYVNDTTGGHYAVINIETKERVWEG